MLLYELCTGRNLFECDVYENVTNEVLVGIARWSDEDLVNRLQPFKSLDRRWPVGLLAMLLNKDPSNRPCDWNVVIRMLEQSVTPVLSEQQSNGEIALFASSSEHGSGGIRSSMDQEIRLFNHSDLT